MKHTWMVGVALSLVSMALAGGGGQPPAASPAPPAPPVAAPAHPVTAPAAQPVAAALPAKSAAGNPILYSTRAASAPLLDGQATEAFWRTAPAMTVETTEAEAPGVANASETQVTFKSVYTADSVYYLVTWKDPTYSIDRQRWAFDGQNWAKEDQNPLDKGGANTLYEDKIAFMWSVNAPTFEADGPYATYRTMEEARQAGYQRPVKTAPKGESLDMWHFKLVRNGFTTPGQVDDQFVNDIFDVKTGPEAGRTSDKGEGGYYNNEREMTLADGTKIKVPRFGFANGATNEMLMTQDMIDSGRVVELTDAQVMALPAGAHLPAVIGRPFSGSRGDITAGFHWNSGVYTLEFGRKLNTGDLERDVTFSDLTKTYFFGVATFDNTQIKHAVSELIEFKFLR